MASTWEPGPGLRSLVVPVTLIVLVGAALPLWWGLWLPLLVLFVLFVAVEHRAAAVDRAVASAGGWRTVLGSLAPRERAVLVALVAVPGIALATVAARAVGALFVAYPGAIWSLTVIVAGVVSLRFARGWFALATLCSCALLVPVAGVLGTRYEAGAADARGSASSGPILGIHPFQSTSVLIDGYGPFDLSLNDYVEPDGFRGYGPETLAAAIEAALHRIAEVQFHDGPARARAAFGGATVESIITPAVQELLSRPPGEIDQPRFEVRSGTWGQRSRVEFICPGTRNDPRGRKPDNVMSRMCPDKYASEASAGLGLTGRWAGYTEFRGNERVGLSRLFSWTRTDDPEGRRVVELELRIWAWGLLGLVLMAFGFRRRTVVCGVQALGGALVVLGVVALVVLAVLWAPPVRVGLVERPPAWVDPVRISPWLAALPLCLAPVGLGRLAGLRGTTPPGARLVPRLRYVPVIVATWVLAGALSAQTWVRPALATHEGQLALEGFVQQLADPLARYGVVGVLEAEGAVAACLAVALLGLLVGLPATLDHALAWAPDGNWVRRLAGPAMVLVPAALLVVSRKTAGGSALVPGAVAIFAVLASSINLAARRREPHSWRRIAGHLAWVAVAAAVLFETLREAPVLSPFLVMCVLAGAAAVAAALILLPGPPQGLSGANPTPGEDG